MTRFEKACAAAASVLLILSPPCNAEAQTKAASGDRSAIETARVSQNRAMAAGNLDSAAGFWTEDVTIRRGLGQPVVGRAAYRALLIRSGAGDSSLVYQRRTTEVVVSPQWPLAFESGTWAGRVGSATGPAAIMGRYSAQWVKRDGRWLIRSEVFVALTCAGVGCRSTAAP